MTKKLPLSEFLRDCSSPSEVSPFLNYRGETTLTIPLVEFCSTLIQHTAPFYINGVSFTSLIPSKNNIYFFNEGSNDDFILIFDPIIDIKQRNGIFSIFYYPDKVITIELKESNVKESQSLT